MKAAPAIVITMDVNDTLQCILANVCVLDLAACELVCTQWRSIIHGAHWPVVIEQLVTNPTNRGGGKYVYYSVNVNNEGLHKFTIVLNIGAVITLSAVQNERSSACFALDRICIEYIYKKRVPVKLGNIWTTISGRTILSGLPISISVLEKISREIIAVHQ